MNTDQFEHATLSNLERGAIEELFQIYLQKVLESIHDINTPATKARVISIQIAFKPTTEARREIVVGFEVDAKLPTARKGGTVIYSGDHKINGKYRAVEANPAQMVLSEAEVAASSKDPNQTSPAPTA